MSNLSLINDNIFIHPNLACEMCDPEHLYIALSKRLLYRPSQFRDSRSKNKSSWNWIISHHLKNWTEKINGNN